MNTKTIIRAFLSGFACMALSVGAYATDCVWTGEAGDGKWSTKENWKDEAKPAAGGSDSVVITGAGAVGGQIENDIAGLSLVGVKFSGDVPFRLFGEKITYSGGTRLVIKDATVSVTNACDMAFTQTADVTLSLNQKGYLVQEGAFSGDLRLVIYYGYIRLSGANTHTGGIVLSGSPTVVLNNPSAVGADGATLAHSSGTLMFSKPGAYRMNYTSTITGGYTIEFLKIGDYDFHGTWENTACAGVFYLRYLVSGMKNPGGTLTFHDEVNFPRAQFHPLMWYQWTTKFLKAASFAKTTGSNWTSDGASKVEYYATNSVPELHMTRMRRDYAKVPDAFPGSVLFYDISGLVANVANVKATETGIFDMGGCDQTLDRVDNNGFYQGEGKEHGLITTSAASTLRLEGTADAKTVTYLDGPLSLVWAPPTAAYEQTFSNRTHSLSGNVTVTNGTLRFAGKTTLVSVPKITVEQGGEFVLNTSLTDALKGLKTVVVTGNGKFTVEQGAQPFADAACSLALSEDARVTLPAGATCRFRSVSVGDEPLETGSYSSDPQSPNYLRQLAGGSIEVTSDIETYTWTGNGGDGRWSTAANWQGDMKPMRRGRIVLSNPGDDFEIVNDLPGLEISSLTFSGSRPFALTGNGLKLMVPGEAISCSASAAVTNAVAWELPSGKTTVTTTGGKQMTLLGARSGTGATLELKGLGYVIGGEGSIDRVICEKGGNTIISDRILGEGGVFEYAAGNLTFACGGEYLFDITYTGTSNGFETWFTAGGTNYTFRGDWLAESLTSEVRFRDNLSATVDFYGEVRLPVGSLHAIMKSPVTFHAPVTLAHIYGGNWANDSVGPWTFLSPTNSIAHIAPSHTLKVWFGNADVATNALIRFDHHTSGTGASGGFMELAGHDQVFDRIESDETRLANNAGVIRSGHYSPWVAIPCTMTLRGTASADTSAIVQDAITIVWDPVDPSFKQTFRNRANETKGDIIVRAGTFEVAGSGSFANVRRLVVGDGATFRLDTTAANALKSVTNVVLGAGGALTVASGGTPFGTATPTLDVTAFVADRTKDIGDVPVYGNDMILRIAAGQPVRVINYDGVDALIPVARVSNLAGAENLRSAKVEFVGCASPEKYSGRLRYADGVLYVDAHEKRGVLLIVR